MTHHWSKKQGKVTIGCFGGPVVGYNSKTGKSEEFSDREHAETWLEEQCKANDKLEDKERKAFDRLIQND